MDIAALQSFVSVAELGSFSRAAESLHLSQPAVSKRIAGLEDSLDTRLFDRIGRQIRLTGAGQALLPRARRILLEVQDSQRAIHNLSGAIGGRLSIGTSHHIGLHRLPATLRRFNAAYPEVELDLHFMDSEQVCAAVEHGDLELGVVTLPLEPARVLLLEPLWQDQLRFVVSPQHQLARAQRCTADKLAGWPAILPAEGTYTRNVLENALRPRRINLQVRMSTNYLETIKMMVSIGLGWSILPHTMVDGQVHVLEVEGMHLQRRLGMVRHTERTLSNAAGAFIRTLQQFSEKM
ncbi:MAG: LysR family transcriptional regulator [Granulosicoccaceae bacterium]|jgi:DNA-binding transcriptional LysR family regulator